MPLIVKGKVNLNIKDDIKGKRTTLGNYELLSKSKIDKISIENKDSFIKNEKSKENNNCINKIIIRL